MMHVARVLAAGAAIGAFLLPVASRAAEHHQGMQHHVAAAEAKYPPLPKPGKKIPLENGYSFTYGFDKTPKIGTSIVKVRIFDAAGKQDSSFDIKGEADMPSMRGAHSTGPQPFKVSKKGDYLLPVNFVMPGEWEVRIVIFRNGKEIFRGAHGFEI